MDRRMFKPVRCLFGRPTSEQTDTFLNKQRRLEQEESDRFIRKWGLDVESETVEWSKAEPEDLPDFYSRGYSHKCRRRAVRPCIGKTLSFADSDHEDSCENVVSPPSSPVQYFETSTVEVYIGLVPHQSPRSPVTPDNSPKSENSDAQLVRRKSSQRRLTDMWRVSKRRQRSLASGPLHKRARIDLL